MPDTKRLMAVASQIQADGNLRERAEAVLARFQDEPLMRALYQTPQSPKHHSEGPTVRAHLILMLQSLFALTDGRVRLSEIEEFAAHKELADEVEELADTMMGNAATLEVFCLIHDVGKSFVEQGDVEGEIHYFGHEKAIYRSDVLDLLSRLVVEYRLSDHDRELLVPLVSYHLEPLKRFTKDARAKDVEVMAKFATKQRVDADEFINALEVCALLDQVFGSRHEGKTSATHVVNFLIAEREYAPWKAAEKEAERALAKKRALHRLYVDTQLDGHGIMMLTGMKPGRELGGLLKKIQSAVESGAEVPVVQGAGQAELVRRVEAARVLYSESI